MFVVYASTFNANLKEQLQLVTFNLFPVIILQHFQLIRRNVFIQSFYNLMDIHVAHKTQLRQDNHSTICNCKYSNDMLLKCVNGLDHAVHLPLLITSIHLEIKTRDAHNHKKRRILSSDLEELSNQN
ncbi:CLUMA_CG016802, isoform A [Clunio marinus]|uniref:CLUMA_CG016802, isoform A n=1 Tax=Clunio marinus TaxID=568069 RepID=A0A1J1ITX1_9DIPT|nr:CLUMA_CG016802, isoform A [Clunio marinus]